MSQKVAADYKQSDGAPHQYDIQIAEDGRWFHEGGEIKRLGLVKLFASVLSYEAGQYWLRTPAEAGIITVADAPFMITSCKSSGQGKDQLIEFEDNLERRWQLGATHKLEVRVGPSVDEPRPYLHLDKGLTARISRPVFYELAELAEFDEAGHAGIWSDETWFSLETA